MPTKGCGQSTEGALPRPLWLRPWCEERMNNVILARKAAIRLGQLGEDSELFCSAILSCHSVIPVNHSIMFEADLYQKLVRIIYSGFQGKEKYLSALAASDSLD